MQFGSDLDYLPIIADIKNIYEDLKKLAKNNQDKKEYQEKLKEITNRLNNLITENRELLEKADSYVSNLDANEEYEVEIKKLKRKLNYIKTKQKDIIDKL